MNQFLTGQELVKVWTSPQLLDSVGLQTNLDRNLSHLDLDGDGKPELIGFKRNEESIFIRMSSGESNNITLNYTEFAASEYEFGGFHRFFDTGNGLKQILMVKRDGSNIIGILVGVISGNMVDFTTPIPQEVNNSDSIILNFKNYNSNNFEEIKVTFQSRVEIWEWR
jgi:hypothetical protein